MKTMPLVLTTYKVLFTDGTCEDIKADKILTEGGYLQFTAGKHNMAAYKHEHVIGFEKA
jgi:hypothetical protein